MQPKQGHDKSTYIKRWLPEKPQWSRNKFKPNRNLNFDFLVDCQGTRCRFHRGMRRTMAMQLRRAADSLSKILQSHSIYVTISSRGGLRNSFIIHTLNHLSRTSSTDFHSSTRPLHSIRSSERSIDLEKMRFQSMLVALSSLSISLASLTTEQLQRREVVTGKATFYGGNLSGGHCSFTTMSAIPNGMYGTAYSGQVWNSAGMCGACLKVSRGSNSITVLVSNKQ